MKTVASATVAAALVGVAAAQNSPTVTTPTSLVVCQPAQFTVSGGTAPYFLSILPGGETGATPLENLPEQSQAGSVTWNVDIAAGTSVTIAVRDSTGLLNYSQQVTIQAGTSTACLGTNSTNGGGVSSGSAASSAATSASSAASSRSSSSAAATTSSTSSSSSSSSSSSKASSSSQAASSTPATTTSASSAPSTSANSSGEVVGVAKAGVLGMVVAAVMALVA